MKSPAEPLPIGLAPLPGTPLVSVLTPCYNAERYLAETIRSVQSQTYPHWEMIICDDGSTDASAALVTEMARTDSRIRLVRQENQGSAGATNRAYREAKGEIFAFLDADDTFDADKLERCVAAVREAPDCGFLTHRMQVINEAGERTGLFVPLETRMLRGWLGPAVRSMQGYGQAAPSSGIVVRQEVAKRVFPIPLYCRRTQDAYVIGASVRITKVTAIEQPLGCYRIHSMGQSRTARFTAKYHRHRIEDFLSIIDGIAAFLRQEGFADIAQQFQTDALQTSCEFWRNISILHILGRTIPAGVPEHTLKDAITNAGPWRRFLQIALICPRWIRSCLFGLVNARSTWVQQLRSRRLRKQLRCHPATRD